MKLVVENPIYCRKLTCAKSQILLKKFFMYYAFLVCIEFCISFFLHNMYCVAKRLCSANTILRNNSTL